MGAEEIDELLGLSPERRAEVARARTLPVGAEGWVPRLYSDRDVTEARLMEHWAYGEGLASGHDEIVAALRAMVGEGLKLFVSAAGTGLIVDAFGRLSGPVAAGIRGSVFGIDDTDKGLDASFYVPPAVSGELAEGRVSMFLDGGVSVTVVRFLDYRANPASLTDPDAPTYLTSVDPEWRAQWSGGDEADDER